MADEPDERDEREDQEKVPDQPNPAPAPASIEPAPAKPLITDDAWNGAVEQWYDRFIRSSAITRVTEADNYLRLKLPELRKLLESRMGE